MISFYVLRYNNKIECEVISFFVLLDSVFFLISDVVLIIIVVLVLGCLFDFLCYFMLY